MLCRLSVMDRLTGPRNALRSLRSSDCRAPSWTKSLGEGVGKTSESCALTRSGMRIAAVPIGPTTA
jgi:hypothetical protein